MVFGFGKTSVKCTPQEAFRVVVPKLTRAQVQQALNTATRAEHFSAGAEWGEIMPSLRFAASQFDGVWACCCGHVNGLVHYAGTFPFKVLKCAKCKHVVCKHCQTTISNILKPCEYNDVNGLVNEDEKTRLVKVCSRCGLSYHAIEQKDGLYLSQKCYCSRLFGSDSLCFWIGTACDYRHDPVGAEDLAKQKWADAMVVKDNERVNEKNKRKMQAELLKAKEKRERHERHEQANFWDQADRLTDRRKLQQAKEQPRPATAPGSQASRILRVHNKDYEDRPPQVVQPYPVASPFGQHMSQEAEWARLAEEPVAPSSQLHFSHEHGDDYARTDSLHLEQPQEEEHRPSLSPAMRTAPLLSEQPRCLRVGVPVSQYLSTYGMNFQPETPRSATWYSRDLQSTPQPRPQLDARVETEFISSTEQGYVNEGAYEFLKSTLGAVEYEALNVHEKLAMIGAARVALLEDLHALVLRERE